MASVAVPRAMSYYYLYPFFKTLLFDLGADTILSRPTTKATLQEMSACPADEPCVAVKLYFAHVKQLLEEDCNFIFLPKLISIEKGNFLCPKFTGIPDMVRNTFDMEERILYPRIDVTNSHHMMADISDIAKRLGAKKVNIPEVIEHAWKVQKDVNRFSVDNQLTVEETYSIFEEKNIDKYKIKKRETYTSTLGVIGHPYVLYEWISHDLIQRFRQYGRVVTPEMVDKRYVKSQLKNIYEGHKLWSIEAQMLGAALHLMKNRLVDRLVLVGLFECGPESIIETYIEEEADKLKIPLLKLFLDDQTGEAGLITRIEAFMDTYTEEGLEQEEKHYSIVKIPERSAVKPVVGFPAMGHLDIVVDSVLRECGVETVKPLPLSRCAIELGKELAPEFICLPMTATLGQMIEMLEAGANSILMVGGKGQCRLGWYGQIQELLLRRKGLSFDMIILDGPFPLMENGKNFVNALKKVTGGARLDKIIKSFFFGYHKLKVLDEGETLCRRLRAFEKIRGEADRIFASLKHQIYLACDYYSISRIYREFKEKMKTVETEDTIPLKVRLIGEIWVLLEPNINMGIEKYLASRDNIRVLVDRDINASSWLQGNVFHTKKAIDRIKQIHEAAFPYLSEPVGGHGLDSVGLTALSPEEGIDGVIHMMPFTCMPEIVAQSIITNVSSKLDIPVLSLIISDQTGEAGVETRLDAFLDLLLERQFERQLKIGRQVNGILHWN